MYNIVIDLIGQKFGQLIVIKYVDKDKRGQSRWLCECDCKNKNKIIVLGYSLKDGNTQSCGCLRQNSALKHGRSQNDKTYKSWENMKDRCTNPNNPKYKYYGGRRIKVCKQWMKFEIFLTDMGERPPGLTLDRKNNNKNYCKSNCQWATRKEQARNTRRNRLITCFGKIQCLAAWAEEYNICPYVLRTRIKLGWPMEKALTTPIRECKRRKSK